MQSSVDFMEYGRRPESSPASFRLEGMRLRPRVDGAETSELEPQHMRTALAYVRPRSLTITRGPPQWALDMRAVLGLSAGAVAPSPPRPSDSRIDFSFSEGPPSAQFAELAVRLESLSLCFQNTVWVQSCAHLTALTRLTAFDVSVCPFGSLPPPPVVGVVRRLTTLRRLSMPGLVDLDLVHILPTSLTALSLEVVHGMGLPPHVVSFIATPETRGVPPPAVRHELLLNLRALSLLPHLRSLELLAPAHGSGTTRVNLVELATDCSQLEELILQIHCHPMPTFTSAPAVSLASLRTISFFHIEEENLTAPHLSWLAVAAPRIQRVHFDYANVTAAMAKALSTWPSLTSVSFIRSDIAVDGLRMVTSATARTLTSLNLSETGFNIDVAALVHATSLTDLVLHEGIPFDHLQALRTLPLRSFAMSGKRAAAATAGAIVDFVCDAWPATLQYFSLPAAEDGPSAGVAAGVATVGGGAAASARYRRAVIESVPRLRVLRELTAQSLTECDTDVLTAWLTMPSLRMLRLSRALTRQHHDWLLGTANWCFEVDR